MAFELRYECMNKKLLLLLLLLLLWCEALSIYLQILWSKLTQAVTSLSYILKVPVQILAGTMAILTHFSGFPDFHQADAGTSHKAVLPRVPAFERPAI
jgi:hypothetical protein